MEQLRNKLNNVKVNLDYFYVNFGDDERQLIVILPAVKWNALKYLGLGVGYNFVQMDLEYGGSDDFLSEIELSDASFLA